MKIISGHDYYDSALAYGQDEDLIYLRDDEVVSAKDCPLVPYYPHGLLVANKKHDSWSSRNEIYVRQCSYDFRSISIYVSGKHYGGIWAKGNHLGDPTFEEIFWDYDKFESFVENLGFFVNVPKDKFYSWERNLEYKKAFLTLRDWMTPSEVTVEQLAWIIENRVAIAINHGWQNWDQRKQIAPDWHINCASKEFNLKDLGFARAVDPYTMFQELSMFVGGVLPRNPNPMIEITDPKIKIAKHGFDKWSFRKQKEP